MRKSEMEIKDGRDAAENAVEVPPVRLDYTVPTARMVEGLALMLDLAEYDDVIVTVAHPWGDIEAPLPTWIRAGPGPRSLVTISEARRRDGSPVPLEEIPLQYRNTAESRRLQRLGLLPTPWGPPADEPPSSAWPDD